MFIFTFGLLYLTLPDIEFSENENKYLPLSEEDDVLDFDTIKDTLTHAFKKAFRPEFVNRIDEVFLFEPFSKSEVKTIIRKKFNISHIQNIGKHNRTKPKPINKFWL